ncbi:hypothetical protein [Aliikangiella sp. IMCC44632]
MNNLISALEELSCVANFANNNEAIEKTLAPYNLPSEVIQAIIARDVSYLESILGKKHEIVCMLVPAKDDDDEDDSKQDDDNDKPAESSHLAVVNF